MGPKRDRDRPEGKPLTPLDPIELGAENAPPAPHPESSVPAAKENWLAGLVRADVLALTGLAVLVTTVVGMPFLRFAETMLMFAGPWNTGLMGEAWTFIPVLAAAAVAALLGLTALRQAARQDASGWVRAVAGTSAMLGLLICLGTVVTWLYASESELFDNFSRFF